MVMLPGNPPEGISQADLDMLNRRLATATRAHNTTPDPEMGGLSPEQVARLIHLEWGEAGSPVRFNTDIPLAELEKAAFFREARILLKAISDSGGVKATSSKNLPRGFVSDAIRLICDEKTIEAIWKYNKVVKERDVWPLHIARVVAQTAGLIRLCKGKFIVPGAKVELLADERAGELFCCLFVTFCRKFNMAYAHPCGVEARGLQSCVGYTLYRLETVAADWRALEGLPEQVLLPGVRDEIDDEIRGHVCWTVGNILTGRLIARLIQWGLLEGRYERESKFGPDLTAVRITPLFRAFLRFSIEP